MTIERLTESRLFSGQLDHGVFREWLLRKDKQKTVNLPAADLIAAAIRSVMPGWA